MKKRVLILDDNKDILDVVNEVLLYEDYDVAATYLAQDFFVEINRKIPDIIILDYLLLDGNGGEICRQLKASEETKHIPVILFSAYIHKEDDLKHFGCDAIIAKPFNLVDLINTVERVTGTIY